MGIHDDKIVYVEFSKGCTFKSLIDALFVDMKRATLQIAPKGLYLCQTDEAKHVLVDLFFPMEHFESYHCKAPYAFSLNVNHTHKMLKNVKKKDSIIMYIETKIPEKLRLIVIPPETTKGSNYKSETIGINIKKEDYVPVDLPEVCEHPTTKEEVNVYGNPKIVKSVDFQKMKKITTIGKKVDVKMQNNHYIRFSNNYGDLYDTEFEYGKVIQHTEASEEESDEFAVGDMYEASFPVKSFTLLMKLPGLCKHLQFYKPSIKHYPMKVVVYATELGDIKIYLKDTDAITVEETQREEGGSS